MEHRLFSWIKVQSQEKGVAPSREKICSQALDFISAGAPDEVRRHLSALLHGSPRKQRKWLARFRKRWGQSLVLRPRDDVPLALRKLKAAQILKQKTFHTHFKTNLNIIRPDPFLGPHYGKALLLDMVPRPYFWGRLAAPVSGPFLLPCRLWRISSGSMLQWMRRRRRGPLFSSIWTKLQFCGVSWLAWHGCQGHFEDASGY